MAEKSLSAPQKPYQSIPSRNMSKQMCGSRLGLVCESGREAMQINKNILNSLLTIILINERDVPSSSKKVVHPWLRHNVQQLHLAMSSLECE